MGVGKEDILRWSRGVGFRRRRRRGGAQGALAERVVFVPVLAHASLATLSAVRARKHTQCILKGGTVSGEHRDDDGPRGFVRVRARALRQGRRTVSQGCKSTSRAGRVLLRHSIDFEFPLQTHGGMRRSIDDRVQSRGEPCRRRKGWPVQRRLQLSERLLRRPRGFRNLFD